MNKNKRKSQIPPKTQTKSYQKKSNNRHRSKSKSKVANTESSSPTSKTEIKHQNNSEILDIKDITEKLGNSKIFCRDEEKKEILDFIQLKEKNSKTLFVSGQPGTGKTSLILEILNNDLAENKEYFLKFSINCLSINSTDDFYENVFKYLNDPCRYNYFEEKLGEKNQKNLINILKEELGLGKEDKYFKFMKTALNNDIICKIYKKEELRNIYLSLCKIDPETYKNKKYQRRYLNEEELNEIDNQKRIEEEQKKKKEMKETEEYINKKFSEIEDKNSFENLYNFYYR